MFSSTIHHIFLLVWWNSAYFARPISIAVVYEHTTWQRSPEAPPEPLEQLNPKTIASATPKTPITQKRQVHLQCSGRIVCTATSTVRITSPDSSHLFLVEKYAIGQMFRRLEKLPLFDLLSVGLGPYTQGDDIGFNGNSFKLHATPHRELWRRYKLTVPSFECDIVEVFPDRRMFIQGEAWLDDRAVLNSSASESWQRASKELEVWASTHIPGFVKTSHTFLLALAFILMLVYELVSFLAGGSDRCWIQPAFSQAVQVLYIHYNCWLDISSLITVHASLIL